MKRGPYFIYCIGQICSVKKPVCNDDQKDSRKNKDKPTVKTKAERSSAKLEPLPQRQFHACKTGFAGNEEWDGTIIAMASDGPTHTAHSLGTCVSSPPLVLHFTFPTIHVGCRSSSPSHLYSRNPVPPCSLCYLLQSQCDIAEALLPSRKDCAHYSCLLLSTTFTSM